MLGDTLFLLNVGLVSGRRGALGNPQGSGWVRSCLTVETDLQVKTSVMHSKRRAPQVRSSSIFKRFVPRWLPFCGHSATKTSGAGISSGAETGLVTGVPLAGVAQP